MKRLLALTLSVTLLAALGGCGAPAPAPSSVAPAPSNVATPPSSVAPTASSVAPAPSSITPIFQDEPLMVADAAMYRGTVTEAAKEADGTVLTLTQAKGTDFGSPTAKFRLTGDTRVSFPVADLDGDMTGKYLEVYYGAAPNTATDYTAVQDAIAVNSHMEEAMVNFNGVVKEITPRSDKPGEGQILMENLDNPEFVVAFNYGPETNFYLDEKALKPGDKLNVFHSPAMTMSLPPQCAAYELRPFHTAG